MTILTDTPVAGIDDQPNNNNKLMIALDVDGTLVDHDGHMSPAVRSAAQAVVASGHDVMIATGRSLNATLPIIQQIGLERGFAVCCNGGVTLRLDPSLEKATRSFTRQLSIPLQPEGLAGTAAERQVRAGG